MLLVRVCLACLSDDQKRGLLDLEQALTKSPLNAQARIGTVSCGESCAAPARLWMQSQDGATYTFDGINLIQDRTDILATMAAYLASPKGWIEDARPCGRLRFCLTARIPA